MPRGRPPKPTTLKWLAGDPGKRARYQTEPPAPEGIPGAPEYLDPLAKEEWAYTCQQLKDMGLLSRADRTALVCYCEAWSRYRTAHANVAKFGPVILSPDKKYPLVSPWHSVMRQALKDVMALSIQFGLSPSSRARLSVKADNVSDSPFLKLVS